MRLTGRRWQGARSETETLLELRIQAWPMPVTKRRSQGARSETETLLQA